MGKGSGRRPLEIPQEQFDQKYEGIFGKRERKPYEPPPLPESSIEQSKRELREGFDNFLFAKMPPLPKEVAPCQHNQGRICHPDDDMSVERCIACGAKVPSFVVGLLRGGTFSGSL